MIQVRLAELPVPVVRCDARGKQLAMTPTASRLCRRFPDLIAVIAELAVRAARHSGTADEAVLQRGGERLRLIRVRELCPVIPGTCLVFMLCEPDHAAARSDPFAGLTSREGEVAHLAGSGSRNREIAERLDCSERTVRAHLQAVYQKLGLRSRVELAGRVRPLLGE